MATDILKNRDIEYPSSDSKPMAETELHAERMIASTQRLKWHYSDKRVYVGSNLFVYYVEGDPRKCVAPDTFVVKNCQPGRRDTFMIWKEGRKPNFVLETTSKKTRRTDEGAKKKIYATIGVNEYFLYDPRGEWLKPALQGFRLDEVGEYQQIPADDKGGVISQELGVRLVIERNDLAMYDVATGRRLLTKEEWNEQQASEERQQAHEERQRANEEKQRADEEKQRADEEKQRADEEQERADLAERKAREESEARRAIEEELARLKEAIKDTNPAKRKNGK